jgi:isoquinoline 1-oxidoreductase beta subunit
VSAFELSRRGFLAGLGAGLVVSVLPRGAQAEADGFDPHVLVHVALDGTVTILCHRSEMGQGIKSSLPVLIGDELGADPARVVVRQADGDKKYADQNTDGSTSIRKQFDYLRKAGAAARTMLVAAAAARWNVPARECVAKDSVITHTPSGRSVTFGAVAAEAARQPPPQDVALKPHRDMRLIGTRHRQRNTALTVYRHAG